MKNNKCDKRLFCDDYKHDHCDGCNANEITESLCQDCKLRVGDYCFCLDEPEKLTGNPITVCEYFFDDSRTTYYEFIDGYEHCNKLKKIALHKKIKELEHEIEELKKHD